MIKENKKKVALVLLGLLLLTGWFYWFQWGPMQIRKHCDQVAWNEVEMEGTELYDWKYTQCLHSMGLK